jgi:hypothetical protein
MTAWLRALPTSVRFATMTSSAFLVLMVLAGVVGYREFRASLRDTIDERLVDVAAVQANAVEGTASGTSPDGELLADLAPDAQRHRGPDPDAGRRGAANDAGPGRGGRAGGGPAPGAGGRGGARLR